MTSSITTLLVVPHTHWDREWHQTYQQFRMRLVKCINHLLLILDTDPNFTNFMLDGQTIILDDYLEIHPEEAEHLLNYVRAGRLMIGPWYIQPDEFLVSGESMIRNLLLGTRQAAPYGGAMLVGYVPDCFGHIAQLPQIFQGFGITNAVFWRGIDPAAEQSEFRWNAPDGSDVLGIYLDSEQGYSNARDLPLAPEALLKRVEQIVATQGPRATTSTLLLMNGSDHLEPQDGLPAVLTVTNTILAAQDQHMILGSLPQYVQAIEDAEPHLKTLRGEFRSSHVAPLLPGVLSTRMWIKQRNAACEELLTRWAEPFSAWGWALHGSYPAGLLAASWRLLLQNQPHDSICGTSIDQVHREMVTRYDQSEQITSQVIQDALQELVQHIDIQAVLPTMTTELEDEFIPIVVFNPTEARSSALAQVSLQVHTPPDQLQLLDEHGAPIPHTLEALDGIEILNQVVDSTLLASFLPMLEEGKAFGYTILNLVFDETVRDASGNLRLWVAVSEQEPLELPHHPQVIERIRAVIAEDKAPLWQVTAVDSPQIILRFLTRNLPAFGGRTYLLSTRHESEPLLPTSDISATAAAIENSWLRVEVDLEDGTLTLTEKASGRRYPGLHCFQDGGDVGDLYNWTPPSEDTLITHPATAPVVELVSSDAIQATLRITLQLQLPVSCTTNRQARSEASVACQVVTDVTLLSGAQTVHIHTTVTNEAQDHRLRVLFPTPIVTTTADAEGTFMINRRPVRRVAPPETWRDWVEEPVDTHPQKRFVSVSNEQHGLALLNRGLPEYEVLPAEGEQGVTLALTLLRCIGWLSRSDLSNRRGPAGPILPTPEAQMPGTWSFDYALFPYTGTWEANLARVYQEASAFTTDVLAVPTGLHLGTLEATWSFIHLEPAELVISAIKRTEDGKSLIVRWYNPLEVEVTADLTAALDFRQAESISLSEEIRSFLPGESDAPTRHWRVATGAGAIQTLCLSPA